MFCFVSTFTQRLHDIFRAKLTRIQYPSRERGAISNRLKLHVVRFWFKRPVLFSVQRDDLRQLVVPVHGIVKLCPRRASFFAVAPRVFRRPDRTLRRHRDFRASGQQNAHGKRIFWHAETLDVVHVELEFQLLLRSALRVLLELGEHDAGGGR